MTGRMTKCMTESELRARVAREAAGWLGVKEGSARHREIVALYNGIEPLPVGYRLKETDPWCAAWISAVAAVLRLLSVLFPECSCQRMVARYREAGRWEEADDYVPQIGDVLFYGWRDSGAGDYEGPPDHVGLVQYVEDGEITVLEGNLGDAVGVRRIRVNARFIRGYGLPDYARAAAELTAEEKKAAAPWPDVPEGAWYADAAGRMARAGLLTGYPDGTYKPQQAVTRAELAAVLDRLTGGERE